MSTALSVTGLRKPLSTRQGRVWMPALYCGAVQRPAAFSLEILGLQNSAVSAVDARESRVPLKMSSSAALPSHGEAEGSGPSQLIF